MPLASLATRRYLSIAINMGRSTDQILEKLLARPLPPLEPGTKVFDPSLTEEIKASGEHQYVIAGESQKESPRWGGQSASDTFEICLGG